MEHEVVKPVHSCMHEQAVACLLYVYDFCKSGISNKTYVNGLHRQTISIPSSSFTRICVSTKILPPSEAFGSRSSKYPWNPHGDGDLLIEEPRDGLGDGRAEAGRMLNRDARLLFCLLCPSPSFLVADTSSSTQLRGASAMISRTEVWVIFGIGGTAQGASESVLVTFPVVPIAVLLYFEDLPAASGKVCRETL